MTDADQVIEGDLVSLTELEIFGTYPWSARSATSATGRGRLGLSPTYARSGDGPPDAVAPGPVDQQQMRQNGRLLSAGEPDRRQPLDWTVRQDRPV